MAIFELLDYIVNEVRERAAILELFPYNTRALSQVGNVTLGSKRCWFRIIWHHCVSLIPPQPPPKLPLGVFSNDFQEFVSKW